MTTYSWIGYVDFEENDPHILCGRIEVFYGTCGWAVAEYTLRYKQLFPNEMDFRDWVDDLETDEILDTNKIFELFLQQYPKMKIQRLPL